MKTNPEHTSQKLFEIVVSETGVQIAERRFFNRVNLRINELMNTYGVEAVLEEGRTEFKPIVTFNDPLQTRRCWFNPILYGILAWLNPDDAYNMAKMQESEQSAQGAAWSEQYKDRQIKKRRRRPYVRQQD